MASTFPGQKKTFFLKMLRNYCSSCYSNSILSEASQKFYSKMKVGAVHQTVWKLHLACLIYFLFLLLKIPHNYSMFLLVHLSLPFLSHLYCKRKFWSHVTYVSICLKKNNYKIYLLNLNLRFRVCRCGSTCWKFGTTAKLGRLSVYIDISWPIFVF